MPLIGAHLHSDEPLDAAKVADAEVVQLFLSNPQDWKAPKPHPYTEQLLATDLTIYVHSPYVINVATTNNRIRIPSRKILSQHAAGAVAIGAKGLIVHGGHVNAGDDPDVGFDNWRKTFSRAADEGGFGLPVLLENTAGGDNAMARRFDRLARLWDVIGEYGVGFCLDTCHAHAGGEDLVGIVDRVLAITGRIDLIHANDSRDAFDSGADRHAHLGEGMANLDAIVEICKTAGCDVLVETPGTPEEQGVDIALLRERLG